MFSVGVKKGHPTGIYHRAGLAFSVGGPVLLDKVPEAVAKDPWLVVTKIEATTPPPAMDAEDPEPTSRGRRRRGGEE